MTNIAIVGAGWTGIGCLRVLLEAGHEVDVFEKNNDIGGTWHPDNNYAGLRLHDAAKQLEYYDFPLPKHIDKAERMTSTQIFKYVKDYSKHHALYKHIKFQTEIKKINYITDRNKIIISYQDDAVNKVINKEYDYVIYTNGFCEKVTPIFPGSETFEGEILHSFDIKKEKLESCILQDKKITVIGASKTATDFIQTLHHYAYNAHWVYRRSYWFFNRDKYTKILKESKESFNIGNFIFKFGFILGLLFAQLSPKFQGWLWRKMGIIHTYDNKDKDFKKFHGGHLDINQVNILKEYADKNGIKSEIKNLDKTGATLKNGVHIETDLIICCTGSGGDISKLEICIDNKPIDFNNINTVYRGRVYPEIPNLVFTAYHNFTVGVVNGLFQGEWMKTYINYPLSKAYLEKNAVRYDHPFFSTQELFNPNDYIFRCMFAMQDQFYHSGELDKHSFKKFMIRYVFNMASVKPLQFNPPKNWDKE